MLYMASNYVSKDEIKNERGEKMMIFGICIGILIGVLIMDLYLKDEKRINTTFKKVINNLEDDLELEKMKVEQRDKFIKQYEDKCEMLSNRIIDLENNVEFLFNNLTPSKKELVRPSQQN